MPKRRRLATILAVLPLAAFLAVGVGVRVMKGPYKAESGYLTPTASTRLTANPVCIETGSVRRGSTLAEALVADGLPSDQARAWSSRLGSLFDLKRVRSEHEYRLLSNEEGTVERLEYQPDDLGYFVVEGDSLGVKAWHEEVPFDRSYRKIAGKVDGSLYASMVHQGLEPALVASFCEVFSYDVDFATETRDGDAFECLVEERLHDGHPVGHLRLLSGVYQNGDQRIEAFWYDRNGKGGWYRANGEALKRAFLKSPLNYTRISSGFTAHRLHPIFKTVRPHLGVDYAAPTGTPVVSVADGTVISAGWVNGYGNLVRVRHANGIETYYAHLSRYGAGMKCGARVDQNEVVGYVGQTGHATGPHLDFRVSVDGQFVNPLTFKSTGGEPLPTGELAEFRRVTGACRDVLARLDGRRALPEAEFAALLTAAGSPFLDTPADGR